MMKKTPKGRKLLLMFLLLVLLVAPVTYMTSEAPMWQDEYVFYRITGELPSSAVTIDWFYEDNPKTLVPSEYFPVDRKELFHLIYDMPIYSHPTLANYLVYPVVKIVNVLIDKGTLPSIESSETLDKAETATVILRLVPTALFLASMMIAFKLVYSRVGALAYLCIVPILFSYYMLSGVGFFYWDAFMWFFFVLTLYLTERKSKWAYLTACFLVNTKIVIGMLLLIPLIIQNRKMAFAALSILPFYVATTIITGDPLYIVAHLLPQTSQYSWIMGDWSMTIVKSFGLVYYFLLTLPILFFVKKYPAYVAAYVITLLYAFGLGVSVNKMSSLFYVGALVFPLVVHEMYERTKGRLRLEVAKQ